MKFKYMLNSYKRKPKHTEVYSLSQIFPKQLQWVIWVCFERGQINIFNVNKRSFCTHIPMLFYTSVLVRKCFVVWLVYEFKGGILVRFLIMTIIRNCQIFLLKPAKKYSLVSDIPFSALFQQVCLLF
jgi:hypothetical protein